MNKAARSTLIIACTLLATASCRREEKKEARPAAIAELPPLAAPAPSNPLTVPGFADAVVVAPNGVTRAAPVVVAVLGIGDTPESQCQVWRELVGQRAFVLCPRGLPHYVREQVEPAAADTTAGGDSAEQPTESAEPQSDAGKLVQVGFFHPELGVLEREVDAGLAALKERYGRYVSPGPVVYAGFSRGAFLGASLVAKNPQRFSHAIFIEGGQSAWNEATTAAFAKGGGKRVLFACGRPSCVAESEAAAALLGKQRVETRVVHGQGEGHDYKKQVKDQIRDSFDWVTGGDPMWQQLFAGSLPRADYR